MQSFVSENASNVHLMLEGPDRYRVVLLDEVEISPISLNIS